MNPAKQSTPIKATSSNERSNESSENQTKSLRKRKSTGALNSSGSFSMPSRSSNRSVYLYEKTIEIFPLKKLPSNREVFQRLYNIIIFNPDKTVKECIKQATKELMNLWEKSSIPTIDTEQVNNRISKMYQAWLELKNDSEKDNLKDEVKRRANAIKLKFDDLFDISHPKAIEMMVNDEDIEFLKLQRSKNRPGYISTKEVEDEEMLIDAPEI